MFTSVRLPETITLAVPEPVTTAEPDFVTLSRPVVSLSVVEKVSPAPAPGSARLTPLTTPLLPTPNTSLVGAEMVRTRGVTVMDTSFGVAVLPN